MRAANTRVSFAGHTHTTEHIYFDASQGWKGEGAHHHHILTAVSGSWWSGPLDHRGVACADSRDGTPNGFHMLAVDGLTYKTRFVPAKEPNGRQMRLSVDSRVHSGEQGDRAGIPPRPVAVLAHRQGDARRGELIANVFDGGPRTKVTMRIGARAPIEMQRQIQPDPFVAELFNRNRSEKKPWVKAEVSSHIWTRPPARRPRRRRATSASCVRGRRRNIGGRRARPDLALEDDGADAHARPPCRTPGSA